MKIVFLGAPLSGKGTQARLLSERLAVNLVTAGDLLRNEIELGTSIGENISSALKAGELIGDQTVNDMVLGKIADIDSYILDGYPRTLQQAQSLDVFLRKLGDSLDRVVYLRVSYETLISRLGARSKKEGREDDTESVFKNRLKIYEDNMEDLVGFYEANNLLRYVSGEGSIRKVSEDVDAAIGV